MRVGGVCEMFNEIAFTTVINPPSFCVINPLRDPHYPVTSVRPSVQDQAADELTLSKAAQPEEEMARGGGGVVKAENTE